jgi:hypothetical protein
MKSLTFILICLFISQFAIAQKIEKSAVPAPVMKTYKSKILDSLATTWEKNDVFYIAHFIKNDHKGSVRIEEKGEWICTQWDIPPEYLTKKVKEYVAKKFMGYKTKSAKVEYKPGGEFYLVGVKRGKDAPVLRFSIKSEFVAKEPVPVVKKVNKAPKEKIPDER